MVETAVNKFGRIDCLVLNAGRSMNIPFEKLTSTDEIQYDPSFSFCLCHIDQLPNSYSLGK